MRNAGHEAPVGPSCTGGARRRRTGGVCGRLRRFFYHYDHDRRRADNNADKQHYRNTADNDHYNYHNTSTDNHYHNCSANSNPHGNYNGNVHCIKPRCS